MGKIIFNADDFGYSRGINYAIIDSHKFGVLTSTTLMTNMPGFDHAVELSKSNPRLGVGVHLTLTCGNPVLKTHKTLVGEDGSFRNLEFFENPNSFYDLDEVKMEWDAQIKKAFDAGVDVSHLDSHHHVHSFKKHREIAIELSRKYRLPLRAIGKLPDDIPQVRRFETNFDGVAFDNEYRLRMYLGNLIEDVIKYEVVEVMCHPGYLDAGILHGSSLLENRVIVADFLMNSKFSKELLMSDSIELVNYHYLKRRKNK